MKLWCGLSNGFVNLKLWCGLEVWYNFGVLLIEVWYETLVWSLMFC